MNPEKKEKVMKCPKIFSPYNLSLITFFNKTYFFDERNLYVQVFQMPKGGVKTHAEKNGDKDPSGVMCTLLKNHISLRLARIYEHCIRVSILMVSISFPDPNQNSMFF